VGVAVIVNVGLKAAPNPMFTILLPSTSKPSARALAWLATGLGPAPGYTTTSCTDMFEDAMIIGMFHTYTPPVNAATGDESTYAVSASIVSHITTLFSQQPPPVFCTLMVYVIVSPWLTTPVEADLLISSTAHCVEVCVTV
jgi:hypothetical protein